MGSLSLFADRQILEVRIASGKPGKDGSQALQELAEQTEGNDALLVLVLLPRLDKATQSSAWFGALEGRGAAVRIDPIERGALPAWSALPMASPGSNRCSFLPTGSKAIYWPRTKRFRSWACCIRRAN